MRRLLLAFVLCLCVRPLLAGEFDPNNHPVKASLISEMKGFTPGQAFTVALRLEQQEGWHTYWRDPGDAGLATSVEWKLPKGVTAGPLLWPKPLTFKDPGGLVGYGYLGQAVLMTEIQVPANYASTKLSIDVQANWLVCREVCIPGDAGISLALSSLSPNQASANAPLFQLLRPSLGQSPDGYKGPSSLGPPPSQAKPRHRTIRVSDATLQNFEGSPVSSAAASLPEAAPAAVAGFGFILFSAFIGGLLLNLMPCVLPVLSLKALSFVEQVHKNRADGLKQALAYTAGILTSFWILAALVLALKHGGNAVGWGFQFQEPGFVLFMAALVLAFALNLFGVFEIWLPGAAMQELDQASHQQGLAGSFAHGLVMTLLATPCSAPFLGTALGFAFTAPGPQLVATFSAVAIGLALPYLLLATVPGVERYLPKPGAWMERFKQGMGFLLMATLLWLIWLLGKQVGVDALSYALAWLLILAFAAWAWGAWGGLQFAPKQRWTVGIALGLLLALSAAWAIPKALRPSDLPQRSDPGDAWIAWDAGEVARLRAQGTPVFVDFTADWCWTCKVNEKAVLGRQEIKDAFAQGNITLMRADWTRRDEAITAALREQGRSGVPMYIFYPAHGTPKLLPEILTPGLLLDTLGSK